MKKNFENVFESAAKVEKTFDDLLELLEEEEKTRLCRSDYAAILEDLYNLLDEFASTIVDVSGSAITRESSFSIDPKDPPKL